MGIDEQIESISEEFDGASKEKSDGQYPELPEGNYQGVIDKATLMTNKEGKLTARFGIRVLGPTHVGQMTSRFYNLSKPAPGKKSQVPRFKQDLFGIGVEVTSSKDLKDAFEVIPGRKITFEIWKSKTTNYTNISIGKLIDDEDVETPSQSEKEDTKAPF